MIISYNTAMNNFTLDNGFGRAGWGIIHALKRLGHTVGFNYSKAPVEITFAQPDYFTYKPNKYQILLTPWESTELPVGWMDKMVQADEVWATSDWVADVYRNAGVPNVKVIYPHGIERRYTPKLKKREGPLRIVNLGGPANRKGSQEAFDAFREVFGDDRSRATLTIKAYQRSNVRWFDNTGRVRAPQELRNVNVVTTQFSMPDLINFTNGFNAHVYPSWGEGFGYLPLETLAQGTPTISTHDWAQYSDYIDLGISADLVESPWQWEHPGQMYKPDVNSICEQLVYLEENYDEIALQHFKNAMPLHAEYDWDILTQNAFQDVFNTFE